MTELATNSEMQDAYKQDPKSLMEKHNLEEGDIEIMLNKDIEAIKARLGPDYSVAATNVITAIKKG